MILFKGTKSAFYDLLMTVFFLDYMQKSYTSVVYNEERTPKTNYPNQLIGHLVKRFNLKSGDRLLEIGCGRGDFVMAFARRGFKCFGVDTEVGTVEGVEIKKCDISKERLPFEDKSFDVVYHKSMIEHLYSPQNIMDETLRVLKDGGKLVFLTPDWESTYKVFYEDITHCRPYTALAVSDLLAMWGFKNIVAEKFYQHPLIWRYRFFRILSGLLILILPTLSARWLTKKTGIKFFQFAVESMILGFGIKEHSGKQ